MKKGFTLIELLAVILILGVIALIAVPTVNTIIKQAKVGANTQTASNIIDAAERKCQMAQLKDEKYSGTYSVDDIKSSVKGSINGTGTYEVDENCNVSLAVVFDDNPKYCYSKDNEGDKVSYYELDDTMSCLPEKTNVTPLSCFDYTESNGEITITNYKCGGKVTNIVGDSLEDMKILENSEGTNMDVIIPNTIEGKPVTTIGTGAFFTGNLETLEPDFNAKKIIYSVVFPSNIKTIMPYAFSFNRISSITLNDGLENIMDNSFAKNELKNHLFIPNTVKMIGNSTFTYNNISTLILGENLITIGNAAFSCNNIIGNLIIPDSVTSVGEAAFSRNDLSSVVIGKNAEMGAGSIHSWVSLEDNYESNLNLKKIVNRTGKSQDWEYIVSWWEKGIGTNNYEFGKYVIYPSTSNPYTIEIVTK